MGGAKRRQGARARARVQVRAYIFFVGVIHNRTAGLPLEAVKRGGRQYGRVSVFSHGGQFVVQRVV